MTQSNQPQPVDEANRGAEAAPRPTFYLGAWGFLRLLGLVYLVAFVSLWLQIDGLLGAHGILPVAPFLDRIAAQFGNQRLLVLPTVFWLRAGDGMLHATCVAGALLAGLAVLGLGQRVAFVLLWALYLSLFNVGQIFLGYQWDLLLLETGFLAMFLTPGGFRPRLVPASPPSPAALVLLRLLLFKLMFSSGLVKLQSGDPTWSALTAMSYHYFTQPLPVGLAHAAHALPHWWHRIETAGTLVVELAVPFLIFAPRRLRHAACGVLIGLQALIALTGNFAFFNLLTIALCVPLLDDGALAAGCGTRVRGALRRALPAAGPRFTERATVLRIGGIAALVAVFSTVGGFHTFNGYGLFAVMTTTRPEILVQGSPDGREWRTYEFRWKPGDPARRPRRAAPHQPRLDWQMWFAALGRYEHPRNAWFERFLVHLLRGTPEVLALLAHDPFPAAPPRFVRADLYEYRFTRPEERAARSVWWTREYVRPYSPVVSLGP